MAIEFTFGIAVGAIVAAAMNIGANHWVKTSDMSRARSYAVNALVGELLHILSHCQYSHIPISLVDGPERDTEKLKKKLTFALFGELYVSKKLEAYSFLPAIHVRNIQQLSLKIRNNDTLISQLLGELDKVGANAIREVNSRMEYVQDCVELLLGYLEGTNPEFSELIGKVKAEESRNFEL